MVDDKELEEKDYYRRRLKQWRELGFDTTELEAMLETDFEHFKTFSMDKLREQLHMRDSEEKIPEPKEAPLPKIGSRTERPIITEFDDIRKQNEEEKEDTLFDIRKEMARRKNYEDAPVRDIQDDKEFEHAREPRPTPKERLRPKEPNIDEDFPLISFKSNRDKAPPIKAKVPETEAPPPKTQAELELIAEEEALARRKRQLLEEEEERLRRKRHLMMGRPEEAPRARPDRSEEERLKKRRALELAEREAETRQKVVKIEEAPDEDEAALIFVDKGHNGEEGDEEMEEEPEEEPSGDDHVRLTVVHGPGQEEPEEVSEVEEEAPVPVVRPVKRTVKLVSVKRPIKKSQSPVKTLPPTVKVSPTTVRPVKGRPVQPPVRKVRPVKPFVKKKQAKKKYPYVIAAVLVVLLLLVAALYGPLKVPTVTAKAQASKDHVTLGDDVIFSGNGSKSSGSIQSYTWDFGDGSIKVSGKVVHHIYLKAGTFNVTLVVKESSGKTGTATLVLSVAHLQVSPPKKQLGDVAVYSVSGGAVIQGSDLYSLKNPAYPLGPAKITVTNIDMTYTGNMTSSVKDIMSAEDGYNETHNTLHREVDEGTSFSATATTNVGSATVTGTEAMIQQVYIDLKTNQTVKTVLHSDLRTNAIQLPLGTHLNPMTSKDDLRSYPDLATVGSQINLEDLYVGKTFNTGDPNTQQGQITKGQAPNSVTYYWQFIKVENVYGRPAVHLNVTVDQNTMSKLSLTSLYIDLWVASDIPTYLKMHAYIEGQNGTSTYTAHSQQVMTSFTAGAVAITGTCNAPHYDNLNSLALTDIFNLTPPQGETNGSIKLSPHDAMIVAMNQSSDFRTFMSSGTPYAISGNYSEKKGPSWNMTFGQAGSTSGYNIIVTDIGGGSFQVMPKAITITAPTIQRDSIGPVVTLNSAQSIFQSDPQVSDELFAGNGVNFATTNWLFQASMPYPNLDFTYTSLSATQVQYAYSLVKSDSAKGTVFSAAVNGQDGQFMWVQNHSGTIPLFNIP